jgi:hypothetical protein
MYPSNFWYSRETESKEKKRRTNLRGKQINISPPQRNLWTREMLTELCEPEELCEIADQFTPKPTLS